MTKALKLTNGYVVFVDDLDWSKVAKYRWYAIKQHRSLYAVRNKGVRGTKLVRMHRFILGITDPEIEVDHEDHDGLNNVRSNLRVVNRYSVRGNAANKRSKTGKSSPYLGVSWNCDSKRWAARIRFGTAGSNTLSFLGYFDSEIDAARAYDRAACDIFGKFANLNFGEFI